MRTVCCTPHHVRSAARIYVFFSVYAILVVYKRRGRRCCASGTHGVRHHPQYGGDVVSLGALLWAGSPVSTSTGLHPGAEWFGSCPDPLLARARAITLGRL